MRVRQHSPEALVKHHGPGNALHNWTLSLTVSCIEESCVKGVDVQDLFNDDGEGFPGKRAEAALQIGVTGSGIGPSVKMGDSHWDWICISQRRQNVSRSSCVLAVQHRLSHQSIGGS